MYSDILVAIDLSDTDLSANVLDRAKSIAGPKTRIHALTVAPTYSMPIVGSYFPPDFEKKALQRVGESLEAFLADAGGGDDRLNGHVAHGIIYEEIMKAADKLNCQLIIMAAHRPELKDYLLGPNAGRVVRHANQSVFVVRS